MMTIKHTLAPWKAPASQFGYVMAIDNYGNPVTVCSARSEADARLIAAAPDMLAALVLLVDGDGKPDECPRALAAARAAIAKAKGGA
jgi:hypothetical protein